MPNFAIERNQFESNFRLDFNYAIIPYLAVPDEEIKIEESDYVEEANTKSHYLKQTKKRVPLSM